jgi:triacylglycerol esterase/lipase EstA (alpha/beta hydrolase family)
MEGRSKLMGRWMATAVAVLAMTLAASASAAAALPVLYSNLAATTNATLRPHTPPPGANDFSCTPSAAHPNPVVLVHGTFENMTYNWNALSPLLKNDGYCVFALNYGQEPGRVVGAPGAIPPGGTGPIERSAAELDAFVDRVLAATGASEVDVVGHSQGGMMPRYYIRSLGGVDEVRTLVGLSPSNHGTTLGGLSALIQAFPGGGVGVSAACGPACYQQLAGSEFIRRLNAGGDTVPGVSYTVIQTRYDEVVTPYTSAFLSGPNVTNIRLQDQCPLDFSEHLAISFDHIALRNVLNALDPANARQPFCSLVLPLEGG